MDLIIIFIQKEMTNQHYNKLDAIIDIYKGENRCVTITKEEYENN